MGYKIAVVPGDGIGQEITSEAVRVLKAVDTKFSLGLSYETRDAGGTAYDKYGTPLPEDTLAVCQASDGVLFGAVGGTKWDAVEPALRPERAILGLRKGLGLYANLRPVKVADALIEHSPLKPDLVRGVDLGIVRELVGHGVGLEMHMPPDVPNYRLPRASTVLHAGDTIAIEPMATLGSEAIRTSQEDGWTILTRDGSLSAHFEHTVLITETGAEILTQDPSALPKAS